MKGVEDAPFLTMVGQFVGYEIEEGYQIKRLKLLTPSGIQSIKLSKDAKASLFHIGLDSPLQPGMTLALQVSRKRADRETKLKAYDVRRLSPNQDAIIPSLGQPFSPQDPHQSQTEIRVCDRGTCHKRGASQVYQALCQDVTDRGLTEQVTVRKTGCLKNCKHGVNVKINQRCHSQVCPAQAAMLIDQHVHQVSFVSV